MIKTKRFSRKIEDFQCEYCGTMIKGDGYTDHCSHCLYSKHVDINPGDRECHCLGLMEPISVETRADKQIIHYRCLKCRQGHQVRTNFNDDYEKILELSSNPLKKDLYKRKTG